MKRLLILFAVMGVGVYLLLSEEGQKEIRKEGKRIKRKLKKTRFPKNEPAST